MKIRLSSIKLKVASIYDYFKEWICKQCNKIKNYLVQNNIEILMFIGLFFICLATFILNTIAGLYVLGFISCGCSIFLLKYPVKK